MSDNVNRPEHYTAHPSGIECIQITEHMGFNLGNALKYIWRCDLKGKSIEDLKKAKWYIDREIAKRSGGQSLTIKSSKEDIERLVDALNDAEEINATIPIDRISA